MANDLRVSYLYISWGCQVSCRASPAYSQSSPPRTQQTRRSCGCWTGSGSWSNGQTLSREGKCFYNDDLLQNVFTPVVGFVTRCAALCTVSCLTIHRCPLGEDGDGTLGHPLLLDHRRDLGSPAVRAHPQEVTSQVVAFRRIQDSPVTGETVNEKERKESTAVLAALLIRLYSSVLSYTMLTCSQWQC